VKLVPLERAGEAALRRFEREVQLTARLQHPNTVAIFDYGRTPDGVFYYAMELLDGTDLEAMVGEHGPLPAGRVIHVLRQVCGALAEAHGLGLVHRDIKPANILLTTRAGEPDVAKVVDFGLVKDVQTTGTDGDPGVTSADVITGTPLYLSPEAILAPESVGARSDLYALGAVGFFLLTGRTPFEGRSILEVCGHHMHTPPPRPSAILGSPVPADLENVIVACLAKAPADRPADALTLRDQLDACAAATEWSPAQASEWWRTHAPPSRPRPVSLTGPRTIAVALDERVRAA
jgi:eukaryotic-like serine/threonine-protein kinase